MLFVIPGPNADPGSSPFHALDDAQTKEDDDMKGMTNQDDDFTAASLKKVYLSKRPTRGPGCFALARVRLRR